MDLQTRYLELQESIEPDLDSNMKLMKLSVALLKDKIAFWTLAETKLQEKYTQLVVEENRMSREKVNKLEMQPKTYAAAVTAVFTRSDIMQQPMGAKTII